LQNCGFIRNFLTLAILFTKSINMKLQLTTTQTIETTMETPAYYRSPNGNEYRGILSDNDYREFFKIEETIFLKATGCGLNRKAIETAFLEWEKISELEFMEKWDEVLEQLSLTPKLKS
jgi:hypothetical protein